MLKNYLIRVRRLEIYVKGDWFEMGKRRDAVISSKNTDLNNYWKKKTIVSFILSIFVLFIHMSSFSQYAYQDTSAYALINFVKIFTKDSFARIAVPLFFIISGATLFRNL